MMNAFYAPTLAGMVYAMPGMQSQLHAILNRPGNYEGYSANYSGAGFSDMRFRLRGVDNAAFGAWVAQAKGGGQTLDLDTYRQLAKPSEKVPPALFAAVPDDLFQRILERCVEPGTPCMSTMMGHDRPDANHPTGAGAGVPMPGHMAMPQPGKPVAASRRLSAEPPTPAYPESN